MHHLSGMSCWEPQASGIARSAYLAMADDPQWATPFSQYVYRIRPDADATDENAAFSALDGLSAVLRESERHGLNLLQRTEVEELMRYPWMRGQYLSRRIPPAWIQSVAVYILDPHGAPVFQRTIVNRRYRAPARMGSRHTFSPAMIDTIRSHVPTQTRIRFAVAPNMTIAPACMDPGNACGGGPSSFSPAGRASNTLVCASQPLLRPGNRMQRAVDVILSP